MEPRPTKPIFQAVVDLGLRDVGVRNQPRRQARFLGMTYVQLVAVTVGLLVPACALARGTGAVGLFGILLPLAMFAAIVAVIARRSRRAPIVVMRMHADGANQAIRLIVGWSGLLVVAAALTGEIAFIVSIAIPTLAIAVMAWRGRGRVPEVLRELRGRLGADETVAGDGIGRAPGSPWSWYPGFRLVVATDRRLLVATSPQSEHPFLLVDAAYDSVTRFGVEWKVGGRVGTLSIELADGETHVIGSMAPANLVSIAAALHAQGVQTDDPLAVSEAERAWEEARRGANAPPRRTRLLDPAAMGTREFDRGLWLLLALSVVILYRNPFGVQLGVADVAGGAAVLLIPVLCGVCGYVSGTRSSLTYIVPLNLLLAPAFFFTFASDVVAVMVVLSAMAAAGLWAGATLRARVGSPPAGPEPGPRPGSLRAALGGRGLVRITGIMLATMLALVVVTSAAGFELTNLRLAIDQATIRQLPVDGRSDLTGGAASLRYTPGRDLHELITDRRRPAGTGDGARWELRSSWTKGFNVVSLASYVERPTLDNPKAIADFVAGKDSEHENLAGHAVTHTTRVVDGRRGYVWNHGSDHGYWYYAAWFPQPGRTVRVECIAKHQAARFKRLCAQAVRTLKFHG